MRTLLPLVAIVGLLVSAAPAAAAAGDPPLTVPKVLLDSSLKCMGPLRGTTKQPLMLVTGTGASGDEAYAIGRGAFDAWGAPVCWVNFPDYTTGDIQVAVQYLVRGIRRVSKRARRPIAVFGISQGGLLPRIALTYWPSLRAQVTDVIAAAGTQHGTTVFKPALCLPAGCPPPLGLRLCQKKPWFQICAALLNRPFFSGLPAAALTMSSSEALARSVPSISLLALST